MQQLLVIHGEDQNKSRDFFQSRIGEFKIANQKEIVNVSGKSLTAESLLQHLQSNSFFGVNRLVVIENLVSGNRSKSKNELLDLFSGSVEISPDIDVIIWESGSLSVTITKKFKNFEIKEFKLPAVIFSFLDGISPNNPKQNHQLFNQVITAEAVELVFFMLAKRIRQLLEIAAGNQVKTSPWQLKKLNTQSNRFSLAQLKRLYLDLIILDYNNKTGNLETSLTTELDMLLIKL